MCVQGREGFAVLEGQSGWKAGAYFSTRLALPPPARQPARAACAAGRPELRGSTSYPNGLLLPAELMPFWMERRWNASVEAAAATVGAAQRAVAGAAAAAAAATAQAWAQRVQPVLAAGWNSMAITASRARALLKGWWLHRALPVLAAAEAALERQLGEGWPRAKGAVAAGLAVAGNAAQRGWEGAARAAAEARSRMEAAAGEQISKVPALAAYARQPYLSYIALALLAALLAPLLLVLAARRGRSGRAGADAQEPPRRRFVARSDTAAASSKAPSKPAEGKAPNAKAEEEEADDEAEEGEESEGSEEGES